jgi:hypothetical protein
MVISSALAGTSIGNSSDTKERMREVFPTFLSPTKRMRTSSRALQPPLPCPTILTFYPNTT